MMRSPRRLRSSAALVPHALAVALAGWITWPAWSSRPPAGGDVMAHLVRADFAVSQLFTQGRLDGWFPRFYAGYEEFLVYGPGLTWLVALARAVTFGVVSTETALTIVTLASFMALPLAVAFTARGLGLDAPTSGVAAVLSLLVSSRYGVGLEGLFGVGLVAHQVGAVLFFVAFGALVRVPVDSQTRWVVLGAAATGGLMLTHPVSVPLLVIFWMLSLVALSFTDALSRAAIGRLAAAWTAALGLSGVWLIRFLAHRDLAGEVATWPTPNLVRRLDAIFDGDLVFRPFIAFIVVAAWLYAAVLVRRRQRYASALVLIPCGHLVIGAACAWLLRGHVLEQLENRGLAYAAIVATFPLAALLAARPGRTAMLAATTVAGVLVIVSLGSLRDLVGPYPEPVPQLRAAATELTTLVPTWARFATQNHPDDLDDAVQTAEPHRWLAYHSGRNSLNGFNPESSVARVGNTVPAIGGPHAPQLARALGRLGVSHVVALDDDFARELSSSPRFTLEWRDTPVAIFSVLDADGQPTTPLSGAYVEDAAVTASSPERWELAVATQRSTVATAPIAWSPKWHLTVDGERRSTTRTRDGLLALELPAGQHTVVLRFRRDVWDLVGPATSVATVALLMLWCRRRRWRAMHATVEPVPPPAPGRSRGRPRTAPLLGGLALLAASCGGPSSHDPRAACDPGAPVERVSAESTRPDRTSTTSNTSFRLATVAHLEGPIAMVGRPGHESSYVALQDGIVCEIDPQGVGTPVLDISRRVSRDHEEQGLLGIAVSPDDARLYVDFTDRDGDIAIVEYHLEQGRAVTESRRDLLEIEKPYDNHNGGSLVLDPDGRLLIGVGDGGHAGDPEGVSQALDSLLGKILRIDPQPAAGSPYSVPRDNPFVGVAGARPEIWALGLRNPWRLSLDPATGDVWIGDVGQFRYEEIDLLEAGTAGANFGWNLREGNHRFEGPPPPGAIAPVHEYPHDHGNCAVIGGHVVRGPRLPALTGHYLFADACSGRVWALRRQTPSGFALRELVVVDGGVRSFGTDSNGDLYLLGPDRVMALRDARA